jgi:hypothetical protein
VAVEEGQNVISINRRAGDKISRKINPANDVIGGRKRDICDECARGCAFR